MNNIVTWDEDKHKANIAKHGITFIEAATVFEDSNALYVYDKLHSNDEDRFLIIGVSANLNMLVVCHCYRENDTVIRIISAQKASKTQVELYNEGKGE